MPINQLLEEKSITSSLVRNFGQKLSTGPETNRFINTKSKVVIYEHVRKEIYLPKLIFHFLKFPFFHMSQRYIKVMEKLKYLINRMFTYIAKGSAT